MTWNYIFFPRDLFFLPHCLVKQRVQLDEMLAKQGAKIDKVLNFAIDDAILEERITGRWIHPSSGKSYHTKFAPPKTPGVDDVSQIEITWSVLDMFKCRAVQFLSCIPFFQFASELAMLNWYICCNLHIQFWERFMLWQMSFSLSGKIK